VLALAAVSWVVLSFLIGLVCGSWFGRCTYWLPREGSFSKIGFPRCPACQEPIPWYQVIPFLSWFLRRHSRECGERIHSGHPAVEIVTAVFFALAFWRFGLPLAIPIWILGSVLIMTTFIDIEFFLIPDLLSKPAIVAGVLASLSFPQLQETSSRLAAVGLSIAGALLGGGILFVVGELGKIAFGRYKVILPAPARFSFEKVLPDDAQIVIDGEPFQWGDHFFREKDRIRIRAEEVTINDKSFSAADLSFYHDRLETAQGTIPLTDLRLLEGRTAYAEFPREAMGLGDVKLIAAIGAFTGWTGALFTIPAASVIGAIYGIGTLLIGRKEWSSKIPFGPYLAIGTVLWLFCGREFVGWYWRMVFG
jgi:leader peptidase (prepilin peptidase)/N-methyltransferase